MLWLKLFLFPIFCCWAQACGGIFKGTTGEINVNHTYYSGYCYFEIQSPLMSSNILLVVEHFQLPSCRDGSVSTHNGQRRYFCGQKQPYAFLVTGSYAQVRLYSYYSRWMTLKAFYFTMKDVSYQRDWNVTVGNISSTTANVSWLPLNTSSLNSTDVYGYVAVWLRRGGSDILRLSVENASSSNTVVRNLKPYGNYEIKVVALLKDRLTGVMTLKSSEKTEIRMKESVPGYVSGWYTYTRGFNSFKIGWGPIPKEDTHGVLLGYVVYFRRYGSYENFTTVKVNASTRVLRITGLSKATRYEIKVAGRTSVGEGPLKRMYMSTACRRTLNGTTGEINVNHTYYSGNCYWDIQSPLMNSSILLVVEKWRSCWNGRVATRYWQWRYFCSQKEPYAFLVTGRYSHLTYYYRTTFKAFYVTMNNVSYQLDWNVTVSNISSTTVNVSWLPLNTSSLNSTDLYGYVAVCLRRGGSEILLLSVENASSYNTVVRNLKPYSSYAIKVVALLKDRLTGVITLKSSEKTDIRTEVGVPGYVPWTYGPKRGFNSLEIMWHPIPEEDTHGVFLGYVVYFRRYRSYENFTSVKVNARTHVLKITGLSDATRYEIKVAGRTSVGVGPYRTIQAYTACGGAFNGTTGEINLKDTDYSGYCYWNFQSPVMNSSILVVVEHFQLGSCWHGSVATRNGQRRSFCGQKEPFAFVVTGSYAHVSYYYYYQTTFKAFYFTMNNVSYQRDWNVTVGNISSTTVNVSWLPLNTSSLNSTDVYGYVAVCFRRGGSEILLLSVENASSSNTVVRNLKPYGNYEVKVVALLKDRLSGVITLKSGEKTDIRMKEDVPGYVPRVYSRNQGSNYIDIYWYPIPEEDTHGVLLGYVVYFRRYRSYENFTTAKVNAGTRVLSITGLSRETTYEIKVAGWTSVGEGPLRTEYASTACRRTLKGTTGEINVKHAYYYEYCYWRIKSPLMKSSILLVVEQLQSCRRGSVATSNGQRRSFCGQKEPFAFLVTGSYANFYYYYDHQTIFKALFFTMNNVSYQLDWNVTVGNISSTTINVSWLPLNTSSLNSTDLYGYVAVCFRRGGSEILLLSVENASSSNTVVRNLKPYGNYEVKVVALFKDRFTGVITLKSGEKIDIRMKESVPGYVSGWYTRARGFNSFEIRWGPIPKEDTHGVLLGYVVYFRRYRSYENFTTVKVNASTHVLRITGLWKATGYEIKVAGRTSVGEGPLKRMYMSTACGGIFNGTTGEINVNHTYFHGHCYWKIQSPLMSSNILLVVEHFRLRSCQNGRVASRNGQRRYFCGQKEPFAFLVTGSYAHVSYSFYYQTTFKAFYVTMNNDSYQPDWKVTVGNISSTTVNVSWLPLNTSSLNSTDVYGYVAVCLRRGSSDILLLSVENTSSASSSLVRNLKPYSNYEVNVFALLKDRVTGVITLKSSEKTDMRTKVGVPGYVPGVYVRNRGFNSIKIYWYPISEEDTHGGLLLGYVVYFRRYGSYENFTAVKVNATTHVLRITGLSEATRYEIKVACRTSVGEGPYRTRSEYTACGVILNGVTGAINAMSKYYPYNSRYCYWEIQSPLMNSSILLVVEHFQLSSCWDGSVATRNGQQRYFCGQKEPFAFLITGSYAQVRLYSNYYRTTLKAFYVTMNNVSHQLDWNVTVGIMSSTTVYVSWLPLNTSSLNSSDVYGYVAVCFRRGGSEIRLLSVQSTSSSNTVVRNLKPYGNYEVKVVALLKDRLTGVITLKRSEKADILMKEGVPGYVPRVYGRNRGIKSIEIYWYPIPKEDTHGVLLGYVVYFRRYGSYENFTTVKVNPSTHVLRITGLSKATGYEIKVAGRTSVGEGPLRTRYESTACRGTLNGSTGEFNVNHTYYRGYCYWTIQSPLVNSRILLVVEQLQSCWYGRVATRNGQRRYFCGEKEPFVFLLTGSYAYVSYYYYYHEKIFKAFYVTMNNVSYQLDWNVTVGNISSTTVNVSWLPLNTSSLNSTDVYGYVAVCLRRGSSDILLFSVENASSSNTVVRNLKSYKKYKVNVVALLKDRVTGVITLKSSEETDIRTKEGVPSAAPRYNTLVALDIHRVFVSWFTLPQDNVGALFLRGYRVHYLNRKTYQARNVTVPPDQLQVELTDLDPYTRYRISIAAFTAMGEGPRSYYYWIKTWCGWSISKQSGEIVSPGFPNYIENSDCAWNYSAPDDYTILLITFIRFNLPSSWNCRRIYLEVKKGQEVDRICGSRTRLSILSDSSLVLRYHSGRFTRMVPGFQAHYYMLNGSLTKAPQLNGWNITAESITSTTISVMWSKVTNAISVQDLFVFVAVCTATGKNDTSRLATANVSSSNVLVGTLKPYTEYQVQVVALIKGQANHTIAMRSSSIVLLRTKEGVPSKPPDNITAHSTSSSSIMITWSPISEKDSMGKLLGYLVQYKEAWTLESYYNTSLQAPAVSAVIKGLKVLTLYRIQIAGFTSAGVGVQSRPHYSKTGCLFFVPNEVTEFTSPNYPNKYPSNSNCTWILGQGMDLAGAKIIVLFDYFHTEGPDNPCSSDFVQVSDSSQSLHWTFCGKISPFAVTISQSYVTVRLNSDNGIEENGFYARYHVVKNSVNLDIAIKEESTILATVTLEWPNNSFHTGKAKSYIVLYKLSRPLNYWNVARTNNTQVSLSNIQPKTKYTVRVLVLTTSNITYESQTFIVETGIEPTGEPTNTSITTTAAPIKRMYPYGPSFGDSVVPNTYEHSQRCFQIDIPDDGMQFFGKRHNHAHICRNGLLLFDFKWLPWWPYNFGQRWWLKKRAMLAPYWSLTDTYDSFTRDGVSRIYYHEYSDSDPGSFHMLNTATSDVKRLVVKPLPTDFKASWVLVITWEKLRPYNYPASMANTTNTFQLVLITDGVYSFVMFNYPSGGLQWSAPTQRSYYKYYYNSRGLPVVGWNAGDKEENNQNVQRSGTVNIDNIDGIRGNTDMVGKWFFRLEDSIGKHNERQECIKWFKAQPDPRFFTEFLEPCPCSFRQARWDERFTVNWRARPRLCSYAQFPSADGWGQECCYSSDGNSWGALLVGSPGGGSAHRYHKLTQKWRAKHETSDVLGYQKCCVNTDMCDLYYKRRPSDDCGNYEVPEWSWLWGDPHLVTLDGKNYTFNGLGEYIMVDARNGFFKLQARTKLAKGDGTATVFSAAAAKENNTSVVQVDLEVGGLSVLIDGNTFNYTSLTNESVTLNGSVAVSRPENDSFLMVFPSGISVTVKVVTGALSIVFAAPRSFKNATKGLLGTWNGDPEDDFLTPNGTTLPSNASSKDIHNNFGLNWQVDNSSTLFTYKPGESVDTFKNASFVPMFLEDLYFANDTLRKQAEEVCQGDINCLFDSASTRDVFIGASTKAVSTTLEKESSSLKNYPPRILTDLSQINVTVNQSVTVTVVAEDPNNDTLSFSIIGVLPTDAILLNNSNSIAITWNGTMEQIHMEFVAKDSKGATAFLRPIINLCACHNDGLCYQSTDNKNSSQDNNKMNVLQCECLNGYTGKFCESDLDACVANLNPCYPDVSCVDLPPPANISGYKCGPCPSGFTGDGSKCQDFDECLKGGFTGCKQLCINTPGSFTCDCYKGYRLNIDQRTCDDVNECVPVSDCMHKCKNYNGGYSCSCNDFFKADPVNSKNCIPDSPCQDGKHDCQHVCFLSSNNIQKCACRRGYLLGDDGQTCKDNDECATDENRCNQKCNNTEGSYLCSCMDGFRLDTDNVTCIDIDECLEWTFQCPDPSQRCQNTQGSYKCECEDGLYWINETCKGLNKDEKPPPPPPAPKPRKPSQEETHEAVIITLEGLKVFQWNLPKEEDFKRAVADSVTTFCAEIEDCITTKHRKRRALVDYIMFTSDQVHLLPGFPEQEDDHQRINLAIYVQFPPGVAYDSSSTLSKNTLLTVIRESREKLEKALNATIITIRVAFPDDFTEKSFTVTPPAHLEETSEYYFMIGGAVAGLIVVVALSVVIYCKCWRSRGVLTEGTVPDEKDKDIELEKVKRSFEDQPEEDPGYINEQININDEDSD